MAISNVAVGVMEYSVGGFVKSLNAGALVALRTGALNGRDTGPCVSPCISLIGVSPSTSVFSPITNFGGCGYKCRLHIGFADV